MQNILIALAAIMALSLSFLIETSSWSVRALSDGNKIGEYISRTNIYLYGGRFFSLIFMSSVSLLIDKSVSTKWIVLIAGASFLLAGLLHFAIFGAKKIEYVLSVRISKLLSLDVTKKLDCTKEAILDKRLFYFSLVATFCFSVGLSVPYILASVFPNYRMTISSLGQIINSLGTVLILFLIDKMLYRAMDKGELDLHIHSYSFGRTCGFSITGVVLALVAIINFCYGGITK